MKYNYPKSTIVNATPSYLIDYLNSGVETIYDIALMGPEAGNFSEKDQYLLQIISCYSCLDAGCDNYFLFLNISTALFDLGEISEAKKLLGWMMMQKFIFLGYYDEPSYILGRYYLIEGSYACAIPLFKQCAADHLDRAKVIGFYTGFALHKLGMFPSASIHYQNFLSLSQNTEISQRSIYIFNLATTLLKLSEKYIANIPTEIIAEVCDHNFMIL